MMLTIDPMRLGGALALSGAYLAMCLRIWRSRLARTRFADGAADWLVVPATPTSSAPVTATVRRRR